MERETYYEWSWIISVTGILSFAELCLATFPECLICPKMAIRMNVELFEWTEHTTHVNCESPNCVFWLYINFQLDALTIIYT